MKISPGINVSFCIEDSIILVTKIVDDIWSKPLFNDNLDIGVEALRYLFGLVDPERMELEIINKMHFFLTKDLVRDQNFLKDGSTVWKNEKFFLTEKIFRKINSLVTYLVKSLLSRNFCQKCVRENSRNFHTVHCVR